MKNEKWEMKIQLWNNKKNFVDLSNWHTKFNYYWFNRQEILWKAEENYSKEKAAEYYKQTKEAIKKKRQKSIIKTCHKKKKTKLKSIKKENVKKWFNIKKKH